MQANPRDFFERVNFPPHPPRHKESVKPQLLGQKNCAKTPSPGQLFSKIQQKKNTKHQIEIMKNSTEMLIAEMFRNIKTVKHIKAQSFLMDGFYGYSKYLKLFSTHLQTNTRIHDKQVPKYDLNR